MLRRTGTLIVLLALVALFAFSVGPASAHHKDGHENGGGNGGGSQAAGHDDDGIPDDNDDNQHPSGKDRETNDGPTDDAQGNSDSDPDDDGHGPDRSNGGPDKPGGSGGEDLDDQDGNNGCGNDDDFEDDNEGWCGGKPKPTPSPTSVTQVEGVVEEVCDKDESMPGIQPCEKDDVGGAVIKVCPAGTDKAGAEMDKLENCDKDDVLGVVISKGQPGDSVLGSRVAAAPAARAAAGVAGAVLPFTGLGIVPLLLVGLGLVATGWLVVRKDA